MSRRLQLHEILVNVLGSRNVYFQPPSNIKMQYPCILYKRNTLDTRHAADKVYNNQVGYMVTVIDANPDSEIPGKLLELPSCRFDRHYTADNLNHDVFNIFY